MPKRLSHSRKFRFGLFNSEVLPLTLPSNYLLNNNNNFASVTDYYI